MMTDIAEMEAILQATFESSQIVVLLGTLFLALLAMSYFIHQSKTQMSTASAQSSYSETYSTRGRHEVAEGVPEFGGNVGLVYCTKHPQHRQFISVDEFSVDHVGSLPSGVAPPDVVTLVKNWAALVVRIEFGFISNQRPDTWADGSLYPLADRKGATVNNSGSGWVTGVSDINLAPCPCRACKKSETKYNQYFAIGITTARHVVFDGSEAETCKVVLFDDFDDSTGNGNIKTLIVDNCVRADTEKDFCEMGCYIHEQALASKLRQLLQDCSTGREKTGEVLREVCDRRDEMDVSSMQTLEEFDKYREEITATKRERLEEVNNAALNVDEISRQKVNDLYGRRDEIDNQIRQTLQDLCQKRAEINQQIDELCQPFRLPVFVVSHPHGRKKYITRGYVTHMGKDFFQYTAETCGGSSGGLVISFEPRHVPKLLWHRNWSRGVFNAPHSFAVSTDVGRSGDWFRWWYR